MNKAKKLCELCNGEAALYCSSDSAFLCWNCDSKVHAANFLVARHLRSILCSNCTHGISPSSFSGYKYHHYGGCILLAAPSSLCTSCLDEQRDSHSCSSDCISSTDRAPNKQNSNSSTSSNNNVEVSSRYNINGLSRNQISQGGAGGGAEWRNWKAEAVLVNWGNKLGISNRIVVEVACHAFGMCNIHHNHQSNLKLTAVPYVRVGLAASLWLSLRLCEGGDNLKHQQLQLKRLEEISGVSTKLIVAAHTKLSRLLKNNKPRLLQQQQQQPEVVVEEGWAEC